MSARHTIRDRLDEVLRRLRFGQMRPLWDDLDEERRENWREHADHAMRLAEGAGLHIDDRKRG